MRHYAEVRRTQTGLLAKLTQAFLPFLLCALFAVSPVLAAASASQDPPATQTELSQKGVSLKVDILTPNRGVASNISDVTRTNDFAKVINNLHMLKRGVWSTRGTGWAKHTNSQLNSGATILEVYPYTDSANVAKVLIRAGDKYYDYNVGTQTATQIGSGFTATDVPSMKVFGRPTYLGPINAYFADGVHELQKWTGSGVMASTGMPVTVAGRSFTKPKFLEEFAGRQAFAGFDGNKNTVLLSDSNSYESFAVSAPPLATDGGWLDVPASMGPITALKTIRLNDTETILLVGCESGVAMVVGSSADDFAVREITREFGIVSHRAFVELQNDVYFMATDGIRKFSTVSQAGLLNSRKSYLIQDLLNKMNRSYSAKTFAFYNPATQEAQWWFPADANTSPTTAVVANFNTADPTATDDFITNPIWSTKDGISPTCGVHRGGTVWSGTSNGYLMNMYSGDTYDGTAIAWQYTSPLVGANSPAQSCSLRKLVILTDGKDQQFTAEAYTLQTMANGVTKLTAGDTKAITAGAFTVPDLGTWASGTTTSSPKLIDFQSKGSGRYWQFRLKGSTSGDHIDLVGVQAILTVGGWSD